MFTVTQLGSLAWLFAVLCCTIACEKPASFPNEAATSCNIHVLFMFPQFPASAQLQHFYKPHKILCTLYMEGRKDGRKEGWVDGWMAGYIVNR